MDSLKPHDVTLTNGETTHYYEGGSADGIPLIFIHGWPDIAEIWKHQLSHFSSGTKYRVIAVDMRGYGDSSAPKERRAYSLEVLGKELVDFASKLHIQKAIWIAHDWGCGVVSALAAHHPDLFLGYAALAVPYRTVELGLKALLPLLNRELYPEAEYEWGQFEYMRYYELHVDDSIKAFEDHIDRIVKVMHLPHDPSKYGEPAATSRLLRDGGWFGGHPEMIPDVPLAMTGLDEPLYENLLRSHKKHGFFPSTAYYMNHEVNAEFAKSEKNGGVLEFPVLYVDAKHDAICSPSTTPKAKTNQEKFAKKLTYETVEAGHWVQVEAPKETNAVLEKWLNANF